MLNKLLIILCLLTSCAFNAHDQEETLQQSLEGKWVTQGFLKNGEQQMDTIHFSVVDGFDPSEHKTTHTIQTDSGTFDHIYDSSSKLMQIDSTNLAIIIEFEFLTDSSGNYHYFWHELNRNDFDYSRLFGQSYRFSITNDRRLTIFEDLAATVDTTEQVIQELDKYLLLIKYESGSIGKYKRLTVL